MNCTFITWLPMDAAKKPCLARLKMLPAIGSPTEPCPGDYQAQASRCTSSSKCAAHDLGAGAGDEVVDAVAEVVLHRVVVAAEVRLHVVLLQDRREQRGEVAQLPLLPAHKQPPALLSHRLACPGAVREMEQLKWRGAFGGRTTAG